MGGPDTVYQRLGYDVLDDDAFQQLVLAWIVEPASKADSVRVLDELGVAHARCARCSAA